MHAYQYQRHFVKFLPDECDKPWPRELCEGASCARCRPPGTAAELLCRCGSACSAKQPRHQLQPVRRRFGVWPPPELLFVQVGRVSGQRLLQGRVAVPLDAFPVDELFAEPPRRPGDKWRSHRVWFRALSAAYHQPVDIPGRAPSPNGGHYWAIVRGVETSAGGDLAAAYRRMDDDQRVGGAQMGAALSDTMRDACWGTPQAERRVALVVLQRVDDSAAGPSPSERANRLGPSMPFLDRLHCPYCTTVYQKGQLACVMCLRVLPHRR